MHKRSRRLIRPYSWDRKMRFSRHRSRRVFYKDVLIDEWWLFEFWYNKALEPLLAQETYYIENVREGGRLLNRYDVEFAVNDAWKYHVQPELERIYPNYQDSMANVSIVDKVQEEVSQQLENNIL